MWNKSDIQNSTTFSSVYKVSHTFLIVRHDTIQNCGLKDSVKWRIKLTNLGISNQYLSFSSTNLTGPKWNMKTCNFNPDWMKLSDVRNPKTPWFGNSLATYLI